jgi:hypothetical protein
MKPTVIIILNRREFKVVDRGDMGTIDLLNVLKTISTGMQKDIRDIDNGKKTSVVCKLTLYPFGYTQTTITTGHLRVLDIVTCIEEIQKKYAKEIVGEVEELQGILKGKDLERYLDQMIAQNNAKGSKNN